MSGNIEVREIDENDRAGWELLWRGYQKHLGTKVPDTAVNDTWSKLVDRTSGLIGLLAVLDTYRLCGLVHMSLSTSSWSRGPLCHLQDLFVADEVRGRGAGHALMDGAFAEADRHRCSQVFWHLNRSDFRARLLLDKYNVGPEGQLVHVRRKLTR